MVEFIIVFTCKMNLGVIMYIFCVVNYTCFISLVLGLLAENKFFAIQKSFLAQIIILYQKFSSHAKECARNSINI